MERTTHGGKHSSHQPTPSSHQPSAVTSQALVCDCCARNVCQVLEMTARRKKRPKKSCFSISSKRRCDAVKRGWCSIVKSAVGEASDRIWAVVVYQSVLRRSDRGVCFFVLLSQYHCLEEAESKVYPSISLFYTVPHLWLFYIKWLKYGKPLTKIQGLTFDPENLGRAR